MTVMCLLRHGVKPQYQSLVACGATAVVASSTRWAVDSDLPLTVAIVGSADQLSEVHMVSEGSKVDTVRLYVIQSVFGNGTR